MPCSTHPQWPHEAPDCPFCVASKVAKEVNAAYAKCECVVKNREQGETQREWFKRWMCQWHWMETDYYQNKFNYNRFLVEAPEPQRELVEPRTAAGSLD